MADGGRIDRREFLRRAGVLGAGVAVGNLLPGCVAPPGPPAVPKPIWDPVAAAAEGMGATAAAAQPLRFRSFMMGGFECSTHYNKSGDRLDLIAATGHDRFAALDYGRLRAIGIDTCRDAARWHLIESTAGHYRFDSLLPMARAAQRVGIEVIWDLMHYGWPDHVDVYGPRFPASLARYAVATVRVLDEHTPAERPLFVMPINEISYLAWAGGDTAYLNPFDKGRGAELKRQLVRAAVEAMAGIRAACPRAQFVYCDPLVHVVGSRYRARERQAAEAYRLAQYQAFDMLIGDVEPGLGGRADFLDVVGVNYYRNNQTFYDGRFIGGDSPLYRPLGEMLKEVWQRYGRTMFIAETGIEGEERARWFRYVASEAGRAIRGGVDLQGITWYPIVDHPGWEDYRHCRNGLWGYPDAGGGRSIHHPLAAEIQRQVPALLALRGEDALAR